MSNFQSEVEFGEWKTVTKKKRNQIRKCTLIWCINMMLSLELPLGHPCPHPYILMPGSDSRKGRQEISISLLHPCVWYFYSLLLVCMTPNSDVSVWVRCCKSEMETSVTWLFASFIVISSSWSLVLFCCCYNRGIRKFLLSLHCIITTVDVAENNMKRAHCFEKEEIKAFRSNSFHFISLSLFMS